MLKFNTRLKGLIHDSLTFQVIYVECRERFIFDEVAHELSVKGFRLFGQFKDDSVFVKNDTIYQTFTLH